MKTRKNDFRGALKALKYMGAFLPLLAVTPSQATVITIDSMIPSQSTVTSVLTVPQSSSVNDAGIWGGWRIIKAVNTSGGDVNEGTQTYVSSSNPKSWKMANPDGVSGYAQITWSGSNDPTTFVAPALDLSLLQYLNFEYVTADQNTNFYVEVWSDASSCSRALIGNVPANNVLSNVQIDQSDFTSTCAANAANFASIGRISVYMDAAAALDTSFRAVTAVVDQPPSIGCTGSTINGVTNFTVPDDACHDLTVEFSVSNTGGVSGLVTALDQLATDMTQTGPISCSNGLTFGAPSGTTTITWNSTNSLSASANSTCTFTAQICGLLEGETRTNVIQASQTGIAPSGSCDASVSRNSAPPPPRGVPTLSEWAQIIMMALMAVTAGWFARRARMH